MGGEVKKPYTIDTAPPDVLRAWLRKADEDIASRHEHWRLGWWISTHAATVTLTLKDGTTITAAPEFLPRAIEQHNNHMAVESARRAA